MITGGTFASQSVAVACILGLACAAGCEERPIGPKWADHQAAHTARYHPDVKRSDAIGSPTFDAQVTQPLMATRPAGFAPGPGPIGSPVLFVNGDAITVQEILEPIIDDLARQARLLPESAYNDYLARKVADEIRNQVSLLVVYQEAQTSYPDKVYEMLDEKADEAIKGVINRRFGGVHARYEGHLKALDLSVADMKERARRQILVTQFLRDRLLPGLQDLPRRELMKHYQAHLDEFTTAPKAELFLIEVPITSELDKDLSQASADEIAAARRRARAHMDRARQELDSGVDFAAVAKRYSRGLRKANGGAWGEITPGSLQKRWAKPAEILFALDQGRISDVIETDESVFIVKCGRRTPRRRLSFEQAQARIIARVKDQQYNRMSNRYIARLIQRATIDNRQRQEFFFAAVAAAPRPGRPDLAREDDKEQ